MNDITSFTGNKNDEKEDIFQKQFEEIIDCLSNLNDNGSRDPKKLDDIDWNNVKRIWSNSSKSIEICQCTDNDGDCLLIYLIVTQASLDLVDSVLGVWPEAAKKQWSQGMNALHNALDWKSPMEIIQSLLNMYPDATKEKSEIGRTPLHFGISRGASLEIIQKLLDVYPNACMEKDVNGETPLYYAMKCGSSLEIIQLLLDACPAAAKERDNDGDTPLHFAAANSCPIDITKALIQAYPEAARMKSNDGFTPLHGACGIGVPLDLLQLLLDKCPNNTKEKDNFGWIPLHWAIKRDATIENVKALLNVYPEGAKVKDKYGQTALFYGMEIDANSDAVQAILEVFPDCAKEKVAIEKSYELYDIFTFLRDDRYRTIKEDVDWDQVRSMLQGIEKEDPDLIKLVASYPDSKGGRRAHRTLLGWCLLGGAPVDIINIILDAYPDAVQRADRSGKTPIYCGTTQQSIPVNPLDRSKANLDGYFNGAVTALQRLRKGLRDGRIFHELCHGRYEDENGLTDKSLNCFFWILSNTPPSGENDVPLLDLNDEPIPGWTVLEILVDADNEDASEIFFQVEKQLKASSDANILVSITHRTYFIELASFQSIAAVREETWEEIAERARLSNVEKLRQWGEKYGRFLSKYKIDPKEDPKHISDTCVVVIGSELCTDAESGRSHEVKVALKFMTDDGAFGRELRNRATIPDQKEQQRVIGINAAFTCKQKSEIDFEGYAARSIQGEQDMHTELSRYTKIKLRQSNPERDQTSQLQHLLVMECGAGKDLSDVLSHQNIAGKDLLMISVVAENIATCLKYLNEEIGIMHGDVKSRNFVPLGLGKGYTAIDLDNSAFIGVGKAGQKRTSSGYLPPEQAAVEYYRRVVQEGNTGKSQAIKTIDKEIAKLNHECEKVMADQALKPKEKIEKSFSLYKQIDDANEKKKQLHDPTSYNAQELVRLKMKELEVEYDAVRKDRSLGRADQREKLRSLDKDIENTREFLSQSQRPTKPVAVMASASYDMWCFGVLLYHLCTGKALFHMNDREDVDTQELKNIVDWNEISLNEKLSRLPKQNVMWGMIPLIRKLLQPNPYDRPNSWGEIISDIQEFGKSTQLVNIEKTAEEIRMYQQQVLKRVEEIPKIMVQLQNVKCPYMFDFLTENRFREMKRSYQLKNQESETVSVSKGFDMALDRAKRVYQSCVEFADSFSEDFGNAVYSAGDCLPRSKTQVLYLRLLCGWTLKPVVSYKVEIRSYSETVQKLAKISADMCQAAMSVAILWNAASAVPRMFGYPVPEIPVDQVNDAKDFLEKINESSPIDELKSYTKKGLTLEDLELFNDFLTSLENEGRVRQCFDVFDKEKLKDESWMNVLKQEVVTLSNGTKQITYVSVRDSERLGGISYTPKK